MTKKQKATEERKNRAELKRLQIFNEGWQKGYDNAYLQFQSKVSQLEAKVAHLEKEKVTSRGAAQVDMIRAAAAGYEAITRVVMSVNESRK